MTAVILWIRRNSARLVAAAALVGVLGGVALAALDHHRPADWLWAATTAMLLVPLTLVGAALAAATATWVSTRSRSSRWQGRSRSASTSRAPSSR